MAVTPAPAAPPVRVIEPVRRFELPDLREIWAQRDLLALLVRRDVVVRYKQSVAGLAWAVLQPLMLAVVFSVFLGELADVPSAAGVPYPVLAVSGMTLWLCFTQAFTRVSMAGVESAELITKVYFPRLVIPLAAALPPAIDFLVAAFVAFGAALVYGVDVHVAVLLFPLAGALAVLTALGAGMWFCALNVRYRDFSFVVPFLVLVGLFVTPVVYPFSLVPDGLQALYALNPMVGVLELWRWMLVAGYPFPTVELAISLGVTSFLLTTGALYFRRAERAFADVI